MGTSITSTTNNNYILNNKMSSQVRQNYHEDCEALINKQINMEFYASYVYLSMASYFNRDDQALHGFAKFFQKSSDEEREHGMNGISGKTWRKSRLPRHCQAKQLRVGYSSPGEAALELEKTVNQSLLDLHKASDGKGDAHLCDFVEAEFLGEQVEGIKQIGDMITKIKRAGDGLE